MEIENERPLKRPLTASNDRNNHFESYHVNKHQHIINNGKERYMKSFSESSKNINGKKSSKLKSVEKNFDGTNTVFEKVEGEDGNVETKHYKIPEEEFYQHFGKLYLDNMGFRSLMW
jgi:hypothetical protein